MTVRRVAEVLALAVVLGFALAYVLEHARDLREHAWRLRPLPLLGATALASAALTVFGALWARLLHAAGERVRVREALPIWFVSNLARYVPGKVWAMSGLAYLARRRGLRALSAVGASLLLQVLVIVTGMLLLVLWLPGELADAYGRGTGAVLVAGAAGVLALYLSPLFDAAVARAERLVGRFGAVPTLDLRQKIAFGAGAAVGWALYGASFWAFLHGAATGAPSLATSAGIFVAGYLAGFLAFFSPGGLGVREGAFVLLLQPHLGPAGAVAAALLSRVWLTVVELLLAGVSALASRWGRAAAAAAPTGGAADG